MRSLAFALCAVGIAAASGANASGLYGRIEAGLAMSDTSGIITDLPLGGFLALTPAPETSSDRGFAGFASIGSDLGGAFKIEGELGYSSVSLSNQTDISELTAMANILLTLNIAPSIDVIAGAGAGFSNHSWDSFSALFGGPTDKSDTAFAMQGILGLDVGLGDNLDLSVRYRYRTADVEIDGAALEYGAGVALANLDSLESQIVTVGLTFGF